MTTTPPTPPTPPTPANPLIEPPKRVMVENIDKLFERGELIDTLVDKTDHLEQTAFKVSGERGVVVVSGTPPTHQPTNPSPRQLHHLTNPTATSSSCHYSSRSRPTSSRRPCGASASSRGFSSPSSSSSSSSSSPPSCAVGSRSTSARSRRLLRPYCVLYCAPALLSVERGWVAGLRSRSCGQLSYEPRTQLNLTMAYRN